MNTIKGLMEFCVRNGVAVTIIPSIDHRDVQLQVRDYSIGYCYASALNLIELDIANPGVDVVDFMLNNAMDAIDRARKGEVEPDEDII